MSLRSGYASPRGHRFRISSDVRLTVEALENMVMTEEDVLTISARLCERGLLKCTGVEHTKPRYELTTAGRLALLRLENAGS